MTTIEEIEDLFDDQPSLGALQIDLGPESHDHSGYQSGDSDLETTDSGGACWLSVRGDYSPPAWRRLKNGARSSGFWRSDNVIEEESRNSRDSSLEYESAEDDILTAATRTRLPTGSLSPVKRSPSPDSKFGDQKMQSVSLAESIPQNTNNSIRFTIKAEEQHRTKLFGAAFGYMKTKFESTTKSWISLSSIIIAFLSVAAIQCVFQSGPTLPVPDLVKVAGVAKNFEPLIYYSENGILQIGDLQDTGEAVWDLGESLRSTNIPSATIIVNGLDDLSDSLKTLAIELTTFFANVDSDIDGILIVMDWAKGELDRLSSVPPSLLASTMDNLHILLSRVGVFEGTLGTPTKIGELVTDLFGQTSSQRTRRTLQRTFNEFLSVLEESVNNELSFSSSLFALFESIDGQFLNLARTVIRESDQQERLESNLLASMWTKVLGSNSANLRKYEKNRELLANVREKVVYNKHKLLDHKGRLINLRSSLETLRRRLVSPLVRSDNSSTLSVEEQILGLGGTYNHLAAVRERQKTKVIEMLYGAGNRRMGIEVDRYQIGGKH